MSRLVPEYEPAVEYDGVRPVAPPEPVLVGPGLAASVDGLADTPNDAVTIVGVDAVAPPLDAGIGVLRYVSEDALHPLRAQDFTGQEVPVPEGFIRDAGDQTEALIVPPRRT